MGGETVLRSSIFAEVFSIAEKLKFTLHFKKSNTDNNGITEVFLVRVLLPGMKKIATQLPLVNTESGRFKEQHIAN